MWPFRVRRKEKSNAGLARWQAQLQVVREADTADEERFFDALRRCLVWYCNDELQLDPFVWLDLAEPGDDVAGASANKRIHAELRALFIELLHNPDGQAAELRQRLESIVATPGRG